VWVSGDLVAEKNGLFYMHSDHLGSTSAMSYGSGTNAGQLVSGSVARYTPFGDWRTEPTADLTNRGYTGHQHNNTGDNDIGLIYMNARYYVPGVARFASADTIIPDSTNPQSLNRYTYVMV
jgi:RHS repeat-associated protein